MEGKPRLYSDNMTLNLRDSKGYTRKLLDLLKKTFSEVVGYKINIKYQYL